jgi:hypothetical protein
MGTMLVLVNAARGAATVKESGDNRRNEKGEREKRN